MQQETKDTSALMDRLLWSRRETVKTNGNWTVEGRPLATFANLQQYQPSNIPGMSILNFRVEYPGRGATPPHTHNGAAVTATVLKGHVITQMIHTHSHTREDGSTEAVEVDSGVKVLGPGETWYEAPGCHHVRSENASDDEDAEFVVNLVIETEKLEKAAKEGNPAKGFVVLDVEQEGQHQY